MSSTSARDRIIVAAQSLELDSLSVVDKFVNLFRSNLSMRYLDDSKLEQIRDAIYNMSTNGLRIWSILDLFQCQTDAQEENIINE